MCAVSFPGMGSLLVGPALSGPGRSPPAPLLPLSASQGPTSAPPPGPVSTFGSLSRRPPGIAHACALGHVAGGSTCNRRPQGASLGLGPVAPCEDPHSLTQTRLHSQD